MKRFVDGVEIDFEEITGVEIVPLSDRIMVRTSEGAASAVAVRSGDAVLVSYRGRQYKVERAQARSKSGRGAGSGEIVSPMPGLIVDVLVAVGAKVTAGQKLLVLEAMKTQQAFLAPFDGVVTKVDAKAGEQVAEGQALATIEPSA